MKLQLINKTGLKTTIFILFSLMCSSQVFAALQTSPLAPIKVINAYTQFGNGDITLQLTSNTAACYSGYWLKGSDAGTKSALAILLQAFDSKANVRVVAKTHEIWPGSAGKWCKIHSAAIER